VTREREAAVLSAITRTPRAAGAMANEGNYVVASGKRLVKGEKNIGYFFVAPAVVGIITHGSLEKRRSGCGETILAIGKLSFTPTVEENGVR
jgi:hypothetical protein